MVFIFFVNALSENRKLYLLPSKGKVYLTLFWMRILTICIHMLGALNFIFER